MKEGLKRICLGFLIGLGVIVPGISGSTIAILFHLYQPLLQAVSQILKQPKKSILFLFPIVMGGLLGLIIGFLILKQTLNRYFFQTICLFAGLMLGSFPTLVKEISQEPKTKSLYFLIGIGILIPLIFSYFSIHQASTTRSLENASFWMLIIGFLIAGTQLIPGLSATALLMMLGYFQPLFNSFSIDFVKSNPAILLTYLMLIIGFLIGLLLISKTLHFLFFKDRKKILLFICRTFLFFYSDNVL